MMYINNLLNIRTSDNVYFVIVVILILISIVMFYLIYSQNKVINESLKRKQIVPKEEKNEPFNVYQNIQENKDELSNENIQYTSNNEFISTEEPELIQLSDLPIPNKLEYTQALWQDDTIELQNIREELENTPKERKIEMTPFEAEQEEKAIISYDELIKKADNVSINYSDTPNNPETNILFKQVDLDKTGQIELDPIKKAFNTKIDITSYEHEEAFLEALKNLKDSLI